MKKLSKRRMTSEQHSVEILFKEFCDMFLTADLFLTHQRWLKTNKILPNLLFWVVILLAL